MKSSIQKDISSAAAPPAPMITWGQVRDTLAATRSAGVTYLVGQVMLGWQLDTMKREYMKRGGTHGGNRRNCEETRLAWAGVVKAETGLGRTTADRFIKMFESVKIKLAKVQHSHIEARQTLAIFATAMPYDLCSGADSETLRETILSLVDGETQKSLLYELRLAKNKQPDIGGDTSEHRGKGGPGNIEQMAFLFFGDMQRALGKARQNPEFLKMMAFLPLESDDAEMPSLTSLEAETRQTLADILEIRKAKERSLKSA